MLDWKTDLNRLIEDTKTFAKGVRVESTMARTVVEPNRLPSVNWTGSEREEIGVTSPISRRISSASKGSGRITPRLNLSG
jgi:hypothetical protein